MILDVLGKMVAVAAIDLDGHFTFVSDHWCEVAGWDREAVLGKHWSLALHPDDLEHALETERRTRNSPAVISHESRILTPDGSRAIPVRSQVAPILDEDGEVSGWLVVAVDLSQHKADEEALRLSRRRLQVIMESSSDIVNILHVDGSWRNANIGPDWHADMATEEIDDENWLGSIHPEDRSSAMKAYKSLMQGKVIPNTVHELRVELPDGQTRWIETTAADLTDDPAVRGIVLHSRDVTERHHAQEELRSVNTRLLGLIKSLHLGVLVIDERGLIVGTNPSLLALMNIDADPEEFVGEHADVAMDRFLHAWSDPRAARARMIEMARKLELVPENRFQLANGRTVAVDFIPISTRGDNLGHVWLVRDVSEEVALVAEREHLLDIEKQQNARLMELDALKSSLVASVSHELRTPLTSIVSFTQLLRDGLGTDSLDDQHEFLDIVARNVDRLEHMVNDLLFLDRIESNSVPVNAESVNMGQLVSMAVSSIQLVAREKDIDVRADISKGPPMRGDVDRLGQMVDNVLANALRYTPPGGSVSVRAFPLVEGWQLEIADTGIGIPDDERDQIFDRFFRATNARNHEGSGSGLGLVIVRRVVEMHRGTISASPNGTQGTRFTLVLRGLADPNTVPKRRITPPVAVLR